MFPQDRKVLDEPVVVEYTARGKRVCKVCVNSYEARSFYRYKFLAGKDPAIVRCVPSVDVTRSKT
jgi:hypothetical protein